MGSVGIYRRNIIEIDTSKNQYLSHKIFEKYFFKQNRTTSVNNKKNENFHVHGGLAHVNII